VALGLALAFAGCGSGDDTTSSTPTVAGSVLPTPGGSCASTGTPSPTATHEPTVTFTHPPVRTAAPGEKEPELANFKPCQLLKPDEIAAVINSTASKVGGGVVIGDRPAWDCTWNGVRIHVFTGTLEEAAQAHAYTNVTMTGLGEDASWIGDQQALDVLVGHFDVTIYVRALSDEVAARAAAFELGTKLVARLPA
jgi:hypothetical protein